MSIHLKTSGEVGLGFESGFDEKIDVIDLIINVLKDHEKRMDELISRLEITHGSEPTIQFDYTPQPIGQRPAITAVVSQWTEFREKCNSASLVAFDDEGKRFVVQALCKGILFTYNEEIPNMEIKYKRGPDQASIAGIDISHSELIQVALGGKLECGLGLMKQETDIKLMEGESVRRISYSIDPSIAKSWIAYQLGLDSKTILQGKLLV